MLRLILLLLALALTGCGSGSSSAGSSSSGFLGDAAIQLSSVLIVDTQTGNIEARVSVPADLTTNASYRNSKMVFVRVDAGSVVGGGYAGTFADADEELGTITVGTMFVSVFEVTQGQWANVMGSGDTPWIFDNSGIIVPVTDAVDMPVYNVSQEDATALASVMSAATGVSVALPSNSQWEYACRAGTVTLYNWGGVDSDGSSEVVNLIANNANVFQTNLKGAGVTPAADETPDVAVDRGANAFGLYDMHGNVAEWTSEGKLRGGSWVDTIFACRSANKVSVDETTPHPLAGVRLVINP